MWQLCGANRGLTSGGMCGADARLEELQNARGDTLSDHSKRIEQSEGDYFRSD